MNLQQLQVLVTQGESAQLEFKRSTGERVGAARTVCAMLNSLSGFVIFGVTDDGKLVGQQVTAQTVEDIVHELRRIEPPAFPEIETITLDNGRTIVALRVPGGSGPYICDGRPYMRVGPTTSGMPQQRYEQLLLERC